MATEVTIPKLGLTMTEAKVVEWLKQEGERVEQGEPLVVVMTAKVTSEIEAPAAGVLHVRAKPGETHKVSEAIGFVLGPGEPVPAGEPAAARPATAERTAPEPAPAPSDGVPVAGDQPREVRSSPAARRLARELGIDIARVQGTGRDGRITEGDVRGYADAASDDEQRRAPGGDVGQVLATPLASRMAEVEGLDLGQIAGTGPEGRITEDDVLRALEGRTPPVAVPLTAMRQAIAERMMHSLRSTAQLTLTARADVTALVELRQALRQRWDEPISYTDLIVKAVAVALREHPLLNSTLIEGGIVLHDEIDVGVAVALDGGLIVPVVRAADRRTLLDLHRALRDLTERAHKGTLSVDEVTGGTFTVTNLGMYGIETFTPIINPPEAAILGVGRIAEELALRNGQVVARSMVTLSLTIDHRVVDGAPGAAFLQTVVQLLEHPALIFADGSPSGGYSSSGGYGSSGGEG